jgi:hypothetical protein
MILVCLFGLPLTATGCQSEYARNEGVTGMAGEAIAADTVMQMVDPWPRGVQHTDIRVPADQAQYEAKSAGAPTKPASSAGSTSSDN